MMGRRWFTAVAVVSTMTAPAYAQRTSENAVNAAEDAFGVSVGNETIGLYTASSARGFNPSQAGNLRINGLYYDQQWTFQGRTQVGTTMRVGLSAQSYPFPAPTGIVDIRLHPVSDHLTGSVTFTYGPYDSTILDTEVSGPIVPGKLKGFATITALRTVADTQFSFRNIDYGTILDWTPADNIDVVMFTQGQFGPSHLAPFIFTSGGVEPPQYDRYVYFGQPWAIHHRVVNNSGAMVTARIFGDWLLRGGLFRSDHDLPDEYFQFVRNVQPDGFGTLDVLRSAPIRDTAYSGEVRLSRTFAEGPRQHTLHLAVRGRDVNHLFGGGASVAFGPAEVGVYDPHPEPVFPALVDPSRNHVSQYTPGVSYVGRWRDIGEFSVGLQKSFFRGEVTPPASVTTRTESQPWLYNTTLAIYLSPSAALYGSYTRGLEESGTAPENAANRGQALTVSLTSQVDAGIRYRIGTGVTLMAGLFEVKKPFFDRNAANVFTNVGNLSHQGIELSFSGQLAPGLSVVAGAVLLRARIEAHAAAASFIAPVPVGRQNRNIRLNIQYGPASWRGLSIDAQLSQDGSAYANRANTVRLDPNTSVDVGARYVFKAFGTPASVRLRLLNVANDYGWTVSSSGAYTPRPPRRVIAQFVADF